MGSYVAVQRHAERTLSATDAASKFSTYQSKVTGALLTNREARVIAKDIIGSEVKWDWDLPRTKEGYYHYKGGNEVRLPTHLFPPS
jgi:isocitrate lyase